MRPTLISIHGIRTDGEWQEVIAPLLQPHFHYVPIKYDHYRRFGAIKLLFVPWILALIPIVAMPVWFVWGTEVTLVVVVAMALVAHIANRGRLSSATDHVSGLLRNHGVDNGRPHAIAHSMGSRILFNILDRNVAWRIDRSILTGCVLPSTMNWDEYVGNEGSRAELIWNEIGRRDYVPLLAGAVPNWLLQGLGSAGRLGFNHRHHEVHTTGNPFNKCACDLRVSNVMVGFDHNDFAGMRVHTVDVWLPILLGYSPHEHRKFVDMCRQIAVRHDEFVSILEVHQDAGDPELTNWFEAFANSAWQWTDKMSMRTWIRSKIKLKPAFHGVPEEQVANAAERAMKMVCDVIEAAKHSIGNEHPQESLLAALNPRTALWRAVTEVEPWV